MGMYTLIEWATHSWSPWMGCSKVHTGCENCYAARQTARRGVKWGPDGTRVRTSDAYWHNPIIWDRWAREDRMVLSRLDAGYPLAPKDFAEAVGGTVAGVSRSMERLGRAGYFEEDGGYKPWRPPIVFPSLCDPFESWDGPILNSRGRSPGERLTLDNLRSDMCQLFDGLSELTLCLLTKRPGNIREMWPTPAWTFQQGGKYCSQYRPNAWLMYSASDQESLEAGLPHLLGCRDLSPVIGLSLEPLLGPIDLHEAICGADTLTMQEPMESNLDWVIVGGESGPGARPCHLEWILDIVQQCEDAGVPCFTKQTGANTVIGKKAWATWDLGSRVMIHASQPKTAHHRLEYQHPKGGDPAEWPEDIRGQQFPKAAQ